MSKRNSKLIRADQTLPIGKMFRPNDRWLAAADILGASIFLQPDQWNNEKAVATGLILLSHILNVCVFSDRLAFLYDEGIRTFPEPEVFTYKQLIEHFPTLLIDSEHPFAKASDLSEESQYFKILGPDICAAFREAWVQTGAEISSDNDEFSPILGDFLLALRVPAIYEPNQFVSHSLSPVLWRKTLGWKGYSGTTAQTILTNLITDLRNEVSSQYNQLRELDVYDTNIPSVLAVALRDASSPSDIFRVTKLIRDEAAPFRKWCQELDSSKDPLYFLQGIHDAQKALKDLSRVIDSKREERMQITLIPGILQTDTSFAASSHFEKTFRMLEVPVSIRKPITFLLNLLQTSRQIATLRDDLVRVLSLPPHLADSVTRRLSIIESDPGDA